VQSVAGNIIRCRDSESKITTRPSSCGYYVNIERTADPVIYTCVRYRLSLQVELPILAGIPEEWYSVTDYSTVEMLYKELETKRVTSKAMQYRQDSHTHGHYPSGVNNYLNSNHTKYLAH